jgi:hypothetical protein
MNWNWLLIGGVVVGSLLTLGYVIERLGVFGNDSEGPPEGSDRVERGNDTSRERIPLRDKPKQLSGPLKAILVCGFAGSAVVSYYVYQWMRTGGPTTFAYATQLQYAGTALIGVAGGVVYTAKKNAQIGKACIEYEDDSGEDIESTETVYFDATRTEVVDGQVHIHEIWPSRVLGLFRRLKLAGHDRRLRGDRPLGDSIVREVPDFAAEYDDTVFATTFQWRTQGERILQGGDGNPVDIRYKPPVKKSYRNYVRQQEQHDKLRTRMESERAKRAEAERRAAELARLVENGEQDTWEDVVEKTQELRELLGPTNQQVSFEQSGQRRRAGNGGSNRQRSNDGDSR